MEDMTAARALRMVVAAPLKPYEKLTSESFARSVRDRVIQLGRMNYTPDEIVPEIYKMGVDIRPSMVSSILMGGDEQGAVERPSWSFLSAVSQERIAKYIVQEWLRSERYPSFDDLAADLSEKTKVEISPKLVYKIVGRSVEKKLKSLGGRSMVDIVGGYAMQGLGRDQILSELDERGLSGVVPPRRVVELWDYYKKLHPAETLRLVMGDDHTYAVQRDPSQYADRIRELSEQRVPASKIAEELGITEVEVWSHLLGAKSDKVHVQMRSKHDQDQAALNAAGRLPTQWEGEGPSPADISRFEGVQNSGQRRIDRFRKLQKGEPTTAPPSRRSPGDYDWAMSQMPELQGHRGVALMNELNARNPEGFVPWTRSHTNKLQRDYVPQQPVMAFARPSDRFVRLSQLNPGPAPGPTSGQAQSPAQPIGAATPQQEAAQKAARDQQITNLSRQVQVARQNEQQQKNQLMQTQRLRQKIEADLVALKQGRSPSPQQVI